VGAVASFRTGHVKEQTLIASPGLSREVFGILVSPPFVLRDAWAAGLAV
jgi:hypothetical protein